MRHKHKILSATSRRNGIRDIRYLWGASKTLSETENPPIFVYRPSGKLRDAIKFHLGQLERYSANGGLWKLNHFLSISK